MTRDERNAFIQREVDALEARSDNFVTRYGDTATHMDRVLMVKHMVKPTRVIR